MTIWVYGDSSEIVPPGVRVKECLYCHSPLTILLPDPGGLKSQSSTPFDTSSLDRQWSLAEGVGRWLDFCTSCGWWVVSHHSKKYMGTDVYGRIYRATGSLKNLDFSNIEIPLNEIRQYLIVRYNDRFLVNPRVLEQLVASVFGDHGYQVQLTSYSGDGGIDLFALEGAGGGLIGVQVKRYKTPIEAEQIRAFGGALVLEGITQGIYVTTSTYRKGAENAAEGFTHRGIGITLWNAQDFYRELRLTTRTAYEDLADPNAPFTKSLASPQALPVAATISAGYG